MENIYTNNQKGLAQLFGLALMAFLAVGLVFFLNTKNLSYQKSSASGNFGPYLEIAPCSGDWTYVGGCYYLKNVTNNPVAIYYMLDCWDESYCSDQINTVTIQPGEVITLGLGSPCSIWQLDINWSGKTDGTWDWGGVAQVQQPCGTPSPSASPTDIPFPSPSESPTPVPTPECSNTVSGVITN